MKPLSLHYRNHNMKNEDTINRVQSSPQSSSGSSYSLQDVIKSTRFEVISTGDDNINITEPSSPSHSVYPYCDTRKTLAGHIKEYDNTPGSERIFEMHKSGTFYEIHPDGTRILRVYGDNFEIALSDNNLIVGGNLNITVQGDANILTKGNVTQKIGGNYSLTVHGNMTTRVEGEQLIYTKGKCELQTNSTLSIRSEDTATFFSNNNLYIQSQDDMTIQSYSSIITQADNNVKIFSKNNMYMKTNNNLHIQSEGRMYLDGSRIDFNLPGSVISMNDITNYDMGDHDPTGGLIVAESVCEPSFDLMKIITMNNSDIFATIPDYQFPKDRTSL